MGGGGGGGGAHFHRGKWGSPRENGDPTSTTMDRYGIAQLCTKLILLSIGPCI